MCEDTVEIVRSLNEIRRIEMHVAVNKSINDIYIYRYHCKFLLLNVLNILFVWLKFLFYLQSAVLFHI